jgi:sugar phosphate isomerase/epimerase
VAASPPPKLVTVDGWKAFADTCARASETLRPLGMRAGFHNHAAEWGPIEGQRPMDILAAGTPPDFVLQLDVGTCVQAGQDPVAWIGAHPGRTASMHCKDWGAGEGRGYAVAFGEGDAPWLRIFQAADSVGGIEHYFLEQEVPGAIGELAMVRKCLDSYRALRAPQR